jgi:beta-lactamase regulating signal transducer with metallopeptidase domain
MLIMAACPVVTFLALSPAESANPAWSSEGDRPDPLGEPAVVPDASLSGEVPHPAFRTLPSHGTVNSVDEGAFRRQLSDWCDAGQPYLLTGWMAGVLLLSVRLLAGLAGTARLRRSREPIPGHLAGLTGRLARKLGLKSEPGVFCSRRVREAIVLGLFRPIVLFPASWLIEVPPDVFEAILAHELAHLRRLDQWTNLFQRLLEVLLFYHPAVWWLSRRVSLEREMCCDELAVAATGERAAYVTALELAARKRLVPTEPLLATAL